MLIVDLLRTGTMRQRVQGHFQDLDVGVVNPGDTTIVQLDMRHCRWSHGWHTSRNGNTA